MAGRGRPKKPTNLAILHGDHKVHPARVNRDEPQPNGNTIAPTEPLDDAAQEYWDRLAPDLIRQGVLTPWDCAAYTKYCQACSRWRAANEAMGDRLITRNGAGTLIQSPYLRIMHEAVEEQIKLGAQFGLTPGDRAKIRVGAAKTEPGADLLSG